MLPFARACIPKRARKLPVSLAVALNRNNGPATSDILQLRQRRCSGRPYSDDSTRKEEFINLLGQAGVKTQEEQAKQTPKAGSLELSQLGSRVRNLMRKVAHSITVITPLMPERDETSTDTDLTDTDSAPLQQGMLVSSFNTVSLVPDPVVSFNIKVPSKTYDAIAESGYFEVSPMWNSKTATRFVNQKGTLADEEIALQLPSSNHLSFGRLFGLKCVWLKDKSIEIGDHIIMLGRVIKVHNEVPGTEKKANLLYFKGGYGYPAEPAQRVRTQMLGAEKSILFEVNKAKEATERRIAAISKITKELRLLQHDHLSVGTARSDGTDTELQVEVNDTEVKISEFLQDAAGGKARRERERWMLLNLERRLTKLTRKLGNLKRMLTGQKRRPIESRRTPIERRR